MTINYIEKTGFLQEKSKFKALKAEVSSANRQIMVNLQKTELSSAINVLNFLAYMIHQLMLLTDKMYQRALEFVGTRKGFWTEIRILMKRFVWVLQREYSLSLPL